MLHGGSHARVPLPRVLGCDYDRTLTDGRLRVTQATRAALARAREKGLKIVVVSGRPLAFLSSRGLPVDAILAENGCVLMENGKPSRALWKLGGDLRERLRDVPGVWVGDAIAACRVSHARALRAALAEEKGVTLELNRDHVMAMPRGAGKAAGLARLARAWRVPPERVAAIGDAENDLGMLRSAGLALAPANAIPSVKRVADHVTRASGGAGVREWLREAGFG